MCKSSFNVVIKSQRTIILGVTSIMPNLNGVLFNTEDRLGVQVEEKEVCDITITYEEDLTTLIPESKVAYRVLDHKA